MKSRIKESNTTFIDASESFSAEEAAILQRSTSVTVIKSWSAPKVSRDVLAPGIVVALFTFAFFTGVGLVSRTIDALGNTEDIWLGAGFGMVAGGAIGAIIVLIQLHQYNLRSRVIRKYTREPQEIREIQVIQPATIRLNNGETVNYGRYKWRKNQLAELSRRMHDSRGRWTGPERLTRKTLVGIIPNLNDTYPTIIKDALELGWIDKDNKFQREFKEELRRRLFIPSPA